MRPFAIAALIVGLAISVTLVVTFGAHDIAAAFARLGPLGFFAICLARAPVVAVLGLCWRFCLPVTSRARLLGVIAARLLRDAGSEVLPFSELGGFLVGARAAMLAGATGLEAAASTLLDLTTEAAAQLAFIALGLTALHFLSPDADVVRPAALALITFLVFIALLAIFGSHSAAMIRTLRVALRRWFARFGDTEAAIEIMAAIARRRAAIALAFVLHIVGWLAIAGEAWLVLRLIGAPISYPAALALESLLFGARSLGFFAPNALGVQEGTYALLAPLLGLSVGDTLALSLVKRARDIIIGAPALLLWQRVEAARLLTRR